jgi:hypothetical protein
MIKLIDILNEINEARQRGELYHFTSIKTLNDNSNYLLGILNSGYIRPNEEKQISTTRNKKINVEPFMGDVPDYIARLTLDGDKISNKYKIRPFYYEPDSNTKPVYLNKGEFEEQIITNGKNFPIYPYLKKVDLFVKDTKEKKVSEIINFLNNKNINYEIHIGPYKSYQGSEGLKSINLLQPGLIIKDNLVLMDTLVTSLPKDLTIMGNLYLMNTPITSLPQNLTVKGSINLDNTKITSLPKDLKVGFNLRLINTPISKKYTKEEIQQMVPGVKGNIITGYETYKYK